MGRDNRRLPRHPLQNATVIGDILTRGVISGSMADGPVAGGCDRACTQCWDMARRPPDDVHPNDCSRDDEHEVAECDISGARPRVEQRRQLIAMGSPGTRRRPIATV